MSCVGVYSDTGKCHQLVYNRPKLHALYSVWVHVHLSQLLTSNRRQHRYNHHGWSIYRTTYPSLPGDRLLAVHWFSTTLLACTRRIIHTRHTRWRQTDRQTPKRWQKSSTVYTMYRMIDKTICLLAGCNFATYGHFSASIVHYEADSKTRRMFRQIGVSINSSP
jgi:hypothetical protein